MSGDSLLLVFQFEEQPGRVGGRHCLSHGFHKEEGRRVKQPPPVLITLCKL